MMLVDLHIHTNYSHDSEADIDALCRKAIENGIGTIAFTDHFDVWETHLKKGSTYQPEEAYRAIEDVRTQYRDRLNILFGIELGEAVEYAAEAKEMLSRAPFEFVIGSLHALEGEMDLFYCWGEQDPPIEFLQSQLFLYFDQLAKIAELPEIHTLAHITYPLRYAAKNGHTISLAPYLGKIDRIFDILIRRGVALEVNTSGLRQKIGVTLPDLDLVKRYYDLGGRLLTIGSDAHRVEDVGAGIPETLRDLYAIGFRHILTIHNGKKKLQSIL